MAMTTVPPRSRITLRQRQVSQAPSPVTVPTCPPSFRRERAEDQHQGSAGMDPVRKARPGEYSGTWFMTGLQVLGRLAEPHWAFRHHRTVVPSKTPPSRAAPMPKPMLSTLHSLTRPMFNAPQMRTEAPGSEIPVPIPRHCHNRLPVAAPVVSRQGCAMGRRGTGWPVTVGSAVNGLRCQILTIRLFCPEAEPLPSRSRAAATAA